MTLEQAVDKMLELRGVVIVSFKTQKWIKLKDVSDYLDVDMLFHLEEYQLIEFKGIHDNTILRVKKNGYKAVTTK